MSVGNQTNVSCNRQRTVYKNYNALRCTKNAEESPVQTTPSYGPLRNNNNYRSSNNGSVSACLLARARHSDAGLRFFGFVINVIPFARFDATWVYRSPLRNVIEIRKPVRDFFPLDFETKRSFSVNRRQTSFCATVSKAYLVVGRQTGTEKTTKTCRAQCVSRYFTEWTVSAIR